MYELDQDSLRNLGTCHIELQRLFSEVSKNMRCVVLCGYRDEETQNHMLNEGQTERKFPTSRHNEFPSRAVDVLPLELQNWPSKEKLHYFGGYVHGVADQLGIKLNWGPYLLYFDEAGTHSPYEHFEIVI